MALSGLEPGAAQRDPLVQRDAVADDRGLADYDTGPVVDEQALADRRRVVDLDPGQRPGNVGDRPRQHRHTGAVDGMRDTVRQQRLNPGPRRDHGDRADAERRGVALACRAQVGAYFTSQRGEPGHCSQSSERYCAKNGVDM